MIIIIKIGGNQKWLSGGKKVSMTTLQVASTFEGTFSSNNQQNTLNYSNLVHLELREGNVENSLNVNYI